MPPLASSNLPGLAADGAGEGSARVAKQLAFQKLLGNGGAIYGDERLVAAGTGLVNEAGQQFLAGAAFGFDQNIRVGSGGVASAI